MDIIFIMDLIGTFVFAVSGIMTAIYKKFDVVGASIIGLVTAAGGGTLRDVLIGSTPVGWMQSEIYILIVFLAVPITYFFRKRISKLRKSMFLFDTIGIGLFTILGIEKTLAAGLSPLIALLMGITSAVFGGVIRDVLCNEIPLIFRREIYASACLAGGLVYLLGRYINMPMQTELVCSMFVVCVIRILAVKNKWHLGMSEDA